MANEIDIVVKATDESESGLKSATTNAREFGNTAQEAGHKAAEGQSKFSEKTDEAATTASTATGAFGALQSGLDLVNLRSTERSQKLDLENQKASTQISNLNAQKAALQADGAARGLSKQQIAAQSAAIDAQVASLNKDTLSRQNDIQKISDQQAKTQGLSTAFMAFQLVADSLSGVMDLLTLAQNTEIISSVRQKVATVASTVAQTAASIASKAWAAAQWLLNAALDANPIGLVVIAIAALVAGIIYAYKHSETFRNIVNAAFQAVKASGIALWHGLEAAFHGIVRAAQVVASAVSAPFRAAFNAIRSAWNSTVGGKGFSVPGWIPGVGGKSFTIPYFAHGGVGSGLSIVGENGPELVDLAGGRVRSNADTRRLMSEGGSSGVTINITPDGTKFGAAVVSALRDAIRIEGGNVQVALGVAGA